MSAPGLFTGCSVLLGDKVLRLLSALQAHRLRDVLHAWRHTAARRAARARSVLTACAAKRCKALLLRALAAWRGERCASRALAKAAATRTRDAMLRQALRQWHTSAAHARQGRRLAALHQRQVRRRLPCLTSSSRRFLAFCQQASLRIAGSFRWL